MTGLSWLVRLVTLPGFDMQQLKLVAQHYDIACLSAAPLLTVVELIESAEFQTCAYPSHSDSASGDGLIEKLHTLSIAGGTADAGGVLSDFETVAPEPDQQQNNQ